jgi:aspartyl-tRNA synthetase
MVGGIDKYFQIARCYRDESGRTDRQPEFTQIDVEMSFVRRFDVMAVMEGMVRAVWTRVLRQPLPAALRSSETPTALPSPLTIPIMTYDTAMTKYGVDKPDVRYDLHLQDVTQFFRSASTSVTAIPVLTAAANQVHGGAVRAIVVRGSWGVVGRHSFLSICVCVDQLCCSCMGTLAVCGFSGAGFGCGVFSQRPGCLADLCKTTHRRVEWYIARHCCKLDPWC